VLVGAAEVNLGKDTLLCPGGNITLTTGNAYATYQWNDHSTDATLTVNAPGKYYVTVTDNCGGTGSDTVIVDAASNLLQVTPDTSKCNKDTVVLRASGGFTQYTWTPQVNLQAQGAIAKVSPDITTKYFVSTQLWSGCTITDSVVVTTLTSPPVTLRADTSVCFGDSVLINAGNLFDSYRWNTGVTSATIMVKQPGKYSVSATFNNGCTSTDTFALLSLYTNPFPLLNKDTNLCIGTTRTLSPVQTYSQYLWNDGSTGPSMIVSTTGKYWVSVVDQHGCKGSDSVTISAIAPLPSGFLAGDTAICQYGKLVLAATRSYEDYVWNNNYHSAMLEIDKPGSYWLQVTDKNHCVGSDTILVSQKQCMVGLYVPNAFTPGNDRKHDLFRPMLFGNVKRFTFMVFNRWGGKVYETQTMYEGWNGMLNGKPLDTGTYVWYCRYVLEGQPEKMEKGTVELIR
jgi:gliding motility-associated-like protein